MHMRSPGSHKRNRMRGFTLVEIIAVLIIFGLLTAVSATLFIGNDDPYLFRTEVNNVRTNLRYAQLRAMGDAPRTDGEAMYWSVTFGAGVYTLTRVNTARNWPGLSTNIYTPARPMTFTAGAVNFDGRGRPVTTAGAVLTANQSFDVSMTGQPTQTITVTRDTGFIQ